jgi:hypothetical protein
MKYFDDDGGMKVSSIDSLLSTLLRAAACTPRRYSSTALQVHCRPRCDVVLASGRDDTLYVCCVYCYIAIQY